MLPSILGKKSPRLDTSVKRLRWSTCCKDDHDWIKAVHRSMIYITKAFLSLKTLSFLHSHNDQITVIASILLKSLNLRSLPFNQLPKMFATLRGACKVELIWTADHIDLANSYWKNKCVMVSSCWQKTHFLFLCQLRLARLSFVRITPDEDTTQTL